jgi:hypothetical protein
MGGPSSIYEGVNPLATSPLDLFIIQLIIVVIVAKILSYVFKFIKRTAQAPSSSSSSFRGSLLLTAPLRPACGGPVLVSHWLAFIEILIWLHGV